MNATIPCWDDSRTAKIPYGLKGNVVTLCKCIKLVTVNSCIFIRGIILTNKTFFILVFFKNSEMHVWEK